ncbi:hypothetical protein DEDE109153_15965 [Deinococcus deserti]
MGGLLLSAGQQSLRRTVPAALNYHPMKLLCRQWPQISATLP